MDFSFSDAERALRDELRAWLAANHPGPGPAGDEASFAFRRAWQGKLHEAGWMGVSWPREYGGGGRSRMEQAIVNEELARAHAPRPANTIAVEMGGPTILAHGTDAQRERYLEPILSAREIWCQAFSEPQAGSDLAALRTRATPVAGGFSVTGQKVWTSLAREARWCMLLARTDAGATGHRGLTYFVLDMTAPGIEVRPIVQLTGEAEFNELFLEDVFISEDDVLGSPGDGWTVALTTLMNERAGIAMAAQVDVRVALDELSGLASETGRAGDPLVRDCLAGLYVRSEALRLLSYRGLSEIERDGRAGPRGSLAKWAWAELNQAVSELGMELCAESGLDPASVWGYRFLRARANSIEGGTTEVLQNIVAERVLGLPRHR
jgi:alkylation response protein AidB-like acyl-CoA dehydrogenase